MAGSCGISWQRGPEPIQNKFDAGERFQRKGSGRIQDKGIKVFLAAVPVVRLCKKNIFKGFLICQAVGRFFASFFRITDSSGEGLRNSITILFCMGIRSGSPFWV